MLVPFLAALLLFADDLPVEVKRFVDVLAAVQSNASDPVQPAKAIYEGAIPGMLRRRSSMMETADFGRSAAFFASAFKITFAACTPYSLRMRSGCGTSANTCC